MNSKEPEWVKGSEPNNEGNYYVNNSERRVLCWQDSQWYLAVKDRNGRYSGYIKRLEKQPKIKCFKSIEKWKW